MVTYRKPSLGITALPFAILLLVGTGAMAPAQSFAASAHRIVLTIDGLDCPYCAYGLRKRLLAIPGVAGVELSLDDSQAVIEMAPGSDISNREIRKAISSAHFSGGEVTYQ